MKHKYPAKRIETLTKEDGYAILNNMDKCFNGCVLADWCKEHQILAGCDIRVLKWLDEYVEVEQELTDDFGF